PGGLRPPPRRAAGGGMGAAAGAADRGAGGGAARARASPPRPRSPPRIGRRGGDPLVAAIARPGGDRATDAPAPRGAGDRSGPDVRGALSRRRARPCPPPPDAPSRTEE